MAFKGHHLYSLDAKNRLTVPPKFRAAFAEGAVLGQDFEPCCTLRTPEGFEAHANSMLSGHSPASKRYRDISRYFAHTSFDTELDSAGRITLTKALIQHAGIQKEVVVAGTFDHVEIWAKERWDAEHERLAPEIAEIAESLVHPS